MKIYKSDCPINMALEVFGDKWTLLVIRDIMFEGKHYFREILDSEEKIASNILTNRLNNLEDLGILLKTNDPNHKQKKRYSLTEKGIDLMPILMSIANWSTKHNEVSEIVRMKAEKMASGGKELEKRISSALLKELAMVSKK